MVDVFDFDFSKSDINFKETSKFRIQNILHNKGFWKADVTYGLELDFFLYSRGLSFFEGRVFEGNFNISVDDFISYLGNEMRKWEISFEKITYEIDKNNHTINIIITTAGGEEVIYAV